VRYRGRPYFTIKFTVKAAVFGRSLLHRQITAAIVRYRFVGNRSFTRFETRLNKFNLETDDASELELRYNNCLQLLDQFEDIQLQIEDLGEDNDLENESQRDKFENNYYRVLGRASEIIKKQSKNIVDARNIQNSSIQSEHQSMPQIKLPEIKLPTFDGRFDA
jgi:hypothetical protein